MKENDLNLKKQLYYAIELSELISQISVIEAKEMKNLIDNYDFDFQTNLQDFFHKMDKIGEAFLPRLKLLMQRFTETSCCPVHTVTNVLAAFLGTKIKQAAEQPTLH